MTAIVSIPIAGDATITITIPDPGRAVALTVIDGISPELGRLVRDSLALADGDGDAP